MQIVNKAAYLTSVCFAFVSIFSYSKVVSADVEGIPHNPEFPTAQYPYAQAPDGCSGWQSTREVRDTWGPVNFTGACNQHDRCYYTFGSNWNTCNERFYSDLRAACERDLRIPIHVPDPTLRNPLRTRVIGYGPPEPASLTTCYGIATTYYAGVQASVLFDVFREAQNKQERYERWVATIRIPPQPAPRQFNNLIAIKRSGGGTTEVHILSGASNFQQFILHTGTALHETDGTFDFGVTDWDSDGKSDLVAISKSGTESHTTEVHILSGASNFQQFILHTGTALHETGDTFDFDVADWDRDGKLDLVAIKKSGGGTTEVHILSGASNFQQFILHTGTALHETGDTFAFVTGCDSF